MSNCNVIVLDPKEYKVWLGGQKLGTSTVKYVKHWCKSEGADLCFNLGFFNMRTGVGETYVHTPQGDLGYGGASEILNVGDGYYCKGYSNGIVNGKVNVNAPVGGTAFRNGFGKTADGHIVIAQSTKKMSEKAFCNEVMNVCKKREHPVMSLFVLEDGGGSTSEHSEISKLTFNPAGAREVATVIFVKRINVPKITRTLRLLSRGEDVKALQIALGGIDADGVFGPATYSRLKKAQTAHGIKADGLCGPVTRATLGI